MTETPALRIRGLAKNHAGERALKGVDLDVPTGSLFGIIGADGAGKSTLLTVLATLMDADADEASVFGLDLKRDFKAIRNSLAFMPQRFSLYPDLTVLENLDFFADLYDLVTEEKNKRKIELLAFSGLEPFQQRKAGQLSGGMKQKLALSCCLLHRPRLLLLDEPTVGVDPVARRDFWKMLKSLQPALGEKEGVTLLISTPYMDEAQLCDSLMLLHQGKMLATGSPRDMLAGYPYAVWRVSGPRPLSFPADAAPPPGAALAYPSGGSLHVAFEPGFTPPEAWWRFFPGAETVVPLAPDIEDLFFALLSQEAATRQEAA